MNPFLRNGLFESREENEANAIFNNPLAGLIQAGRPAQSLADLFRPGGLIGVVPAGRGLPQGIEIGTQPDERVNPMPGEPGHDPDPGFTRVGGLGMAVTKPWYGEPTTPLTKPWYAHQAPPAPFLRQDIAGSSRTDGSERTVTASPETSTPPAQPGPAKASNFIDPKTGKLDYWAWLDAGAANLGKGGVLFEDDMPEAMESGTVKAQQLGVVASGSPENKRMPDEETFEEKRANFGYGSQGLAMNVALKAKEQQPGADAPGEQPGHQQPEQGGQPGQPQPPAQVGTGQAGTPSQPEQTPQAGGGVQQGESASKYRPWRDPEADMAKMIDWVAQYHGIDPKLFQRLIQIESEYNPNKVSPRGATGLGQLMPNTAKGLGVENASDPFQNLMGSAKLFKGHFDATGGNVRDALWRYNAGQGNYAKGIFPEETRRYIQEVTRQPLPDGYGVRKRP